MSVALITDSLQLEKLCNRIADAPRVALDTEFHNERSYAARLMVIQLAFDDGVVIVDPLVLRDVRPLAEALARSTLVGHALSSDLKIFADRFGIIPSQVFDTQVAAAFCGFGMAVSLVELVRNITGVRLKKSQTVSDWSSRPFSDGQVEYLVEDVAHLLQLHTRLSQRLDELGRYQWALEECHSLTQIERYRLDPARLYLRIPGANRMNRRELGILCELAMFRDAMARERDIPLKYVIPDDVLAGLVVLRPRRVEDLQQLRRLDAGVRKSLGAGILEAVERGERVAENELPEKPARPLGNQREGLVAVMNVVVTAVAGANGIPSALLAPRSALERVARELPPTREEFDASLALSSWRLQLIGDPLWRLLSGRSTLSIDGYGAGSPRISYS
ncbi:MAG: HRDC domain-containing protein [Candidatus Eremiobacteraeota bacterium]|nr:HRDC domain-containing protein [Candidatus Eremiobacteraeota bacterium]